MGLLYYQPEIANRFADIPNLVYGADIEEVLAIL
jgi:hypothetical protein